eukprot:jgi/Astpho2/1378/fgenesh1_pg.00025_%23_11_t
MPWQQRHSLQAWFGVDTFLLLEPMSYSKRVLDDIQEATLLLSALAAALHTCQVPWPAFVPVHDAQRDAHWGIAALQSTTVHLNTDCVHTSSTPVALKEVHGQLKFFADQLAAQGALEPEFDDPYRLDQPWDERAPWQPFAPQEDPVGPLELEVEWAHFSLSSAVEQDAQPPTWHVHAMSPQYRNRRWGRGFGYPADQKRLSLRLTANLLLDPAAGRPAPDKLSLGLDAGSGLEAPASSPGAFSTMLQAWMAARSIPVEAHAVGQLATREFWERPLVKRPPVPPERSLQDVLADLFQEGPPEVHSQLQHFFPRTAPQDSLLSRLALHALCYGNARAVAILWQRFLHQLRLQFWDLQCALPRMAAWGQAPAASPQAQERQPGCDQSAGDSAQDSQAGSAKAAGQEHSAASSSKRLDGVTSTAHAAAGEQSMASGGDMRAAPAPDLRCCLLHQKLQLLDVCIQQSLQRAQGCGVGAQGSQAIRAYFGALQQQHSEQQGQDPASDGAGAEEDGWDGSEAAPIGDDGHTLGQQHSSHWYGHEAAQLERQSLPSGSGSPEREHDSMAGFSEQRPGSEPGQGFQGGQGSVPHQQQDSLASSEDKQRQGSWVALEQGSSAQLNSLREHYSDCLESLPASPEGQAPTLQSPFADEGPQAGGQSPQLSGPTWDGLPAPAEGLAGSGSAAFDDGDSGLSAPEGVAEEPPVMTEDMLAERQAALTALGDGPQAPQMRARVQGDLLCSDMSAFKAANPGCTLEDFVRWHSPRDWEGDSSGGGQLSARMQQQDGMWQILWGAAPAVPAVRQKPLMDPVLEGERVLHYLETLPPAVLWDQLLACGIAAAAGKLAACPGASLPVAAQAVAEFSRQADLLLEQPAVWAADERPSSEGGAASPSVGTTSDQGQLASLVQSFNELETIVVAAESLCRRLPHCRILANDLLKEALNPGSSKSVKGEQGILVIAPDELAVLQAIMSQQDVSELQEAAGHDDSFHDVLDNLFGDPLQSEWVTCVLPGRSACCQAPHRLYVLSRLDEMRLATTIVAEA